MAQTEFLIEGMTCAHCEYAIHGALTPLDGVSDVEVSAETGIATVRHDGPLDPGDVAKAVTDAGYELRV